MARISLDPAAAIPDADLLEQRLTVTNAPLTGPRCALYALEDELLRADEADLLEQRTLVPIDEDEDYPNTRAGQVLHA